MVKEKNDISFSSIIGGITPVKDLCVFSGISGLDVCESKEDLETKLSILSSCLLDNKKILISVRLKRIPYVVFYSPEAGILEFRRVYKNKIKDLNVYSYCGLQFMVFDGKELNNIINHLDMLKNAKRISDDIQKEPKIIFILNADKISKKKMVTMHLNSIFNIEKIITSSSTTTLVEEYTKV